MSGRGDVVLTGNCPYHEQKRSLRRKGRVPGMEALLNHCKLSDSGIPKESWARGQELGWDA